jgi:uncharacterized protein (TIGR02594 family)
MATIRVNASLLNVRQQPTQEAAVLEKLPRDTQAEKLAASSDGEWFQVRTAAGTSGWIAAKYALEVAAPRLQINASILNVRARADQGAAVLAKLPRGTQVEQTGVSADGAWYAVKTADGTAGWISAQYAAPASAAAPAASTTGSAAPAPAPVASGDAPWMVFARGEMGQAEIEGAQNNPRIVEYHAATSLKATDDETPWCSAFANWCMKKAGIRGTGQANARSWLDWGRRIDTPVAGCIVVLKRGTSTTSGHVGFFTEKQGDRIQVLGGNQSNRVKLSLYPTSDVLGYRLPA